MVKKKLQKATHIQTMAMEKLRIILVKQEKLIRCDSQLFVILLNKADDKKNKAEWKLIKQINDHTSEIFSRTKMQ